MPAREQGRIMQLERVALAYAQACVLAVPSFIMTSASRRHA